jgi:tetratricopeptide (TPR) repeat protein
MYAANMIVMSRSDLTSSLYEDALQETNTEIAILKLTSVIDIDFKNYDALQKRGILYLEVCEYKKAIYDLGRAISMKPASMNYEYRAIAHFRNNQYREAILDFDRAITKGNEFYHLYLERGLAKFQLSDAGGALLDISKSIQLSPDRSKTYSIRCSIYQRLNLYRLAIKDIETAIKIEPENESYQSVRDSILSIDRGSMSLLDRLSFSLKKIEFRLH